MSTGINTYNTNEKEEWQSAYNEGFEAGKRAVLKELKKTEKNIKKLEAFSTSTGTCSSL